MLEKEIELIANFYAKPQEKELLKTAIKTLIKKHDKIKRLPRKRSSEDKK